MTRQVRRSSTAESQRAASLDLFHALVLDPGSSARIESWFLVPFGVDDRRAVNG